MNSAQTVTNKINNWKAEGHSKVELLALIAEACLGWPYVWGGYGQYCTPSNRRAYADRSSCPSGEAAEIRKKCQVLNESKSGCDGCGFYPSAVVRFFDCRGFTRWVLQQIGISLQGGGATSQWNDNSNWSQKGLIADMPEGTVCCLFMQNQKDHKTMEHTGFCVGGGQVIHCSGTVKRGKVTDRGWTHYAIPKGLEGGESMSWRTTIRKGSQGADVIYCQDILMAMGYDIGSSGADGIFGEKTRKAVMEFQRSNGLGVDGIVGPMTWEKLEAATGSTAPADPEKRFTVTIKHLDAEQAAKALALGGELGAETNMTEEE